MIRGLFRQIGLDGFVSTDFISGWLHLDKPTIERLITSPRHLGLLTSISHREADRPGEALFTVATMMLFAIGVDAQQQPNPTGARGGVTGSGAANTIPVWTGTSSIGNSVMFQTVGNVGIGTATPGAKLDVAGDINFSGVLRFQGSPVLRVFPEGTGNIGLGPSTLQSNITGSTNLAMGERALQNNTSGL